MKQKKLSRQSVLAQMMALAAGEANDVVKLAYLDEERKGKLMGWICSA